MRLHRPGPLHLDRSRLLALAAVATAAVGVVLVLAPSRPSAPLPAAAPASAVAIAPPSATPALTTPTTPASSSSPTSTLPGPTAFGATSAPAAPTDTTGWEPVARGFAVAFTAAPAPGQQWIDALAPWSSPQLQDLLATTDPTRLPTGALLTLRPTTETPDLVVATLVYDSGLQLAIDVTRTPAGWLVSTVLQRPTS